MNSSLIRAIERMPQQHLQQIKFPPEWFLEFSQIFLLARLGLCLPAAGWVVGGGCLLCKIVKNTLNTIANLCNCNRLS